MAAEKKRNEKRMKKRECFNRINIIKINIAYGMKFAATAAERVSCGETSAAAGAADTCRQAAAAAAAEGCHAVQPSNQLLMLLGGMLLMLLQGSSILVKRQRSCCAAAAAQVSVPYQCSCCCLERHAGERPWLGPCCSHYRISAAAKVSMLLLKLTDY
jgi:hypothetical protein